MISLSSVLVSWSVGRRLRLRTEANNIRAEAAGVLGELERSRDLFLSIYPQAQAVYVEASEIMTAVNTREPLKSRRQKARDHLLWKRLNDIHNQITLKLMDERIDKGYVRLFTYYPSVRPLYQTTLAKMRSADGIMFAELLRRLESSIFAVPDRERRLYTASIGNALREAAERTEPEHRQRLGTELSPAEKYLVHRIEASDDLLLARERSQKR